MLKKISCKKIYAIEGDAWIANELECNLKHLPSDAADEVKVIRHYVQDDAYFRGYFGKEEKISLINCDIEGWELVMLNQLKTRIISDRPVLAICMYHKKEDIVDIPHYIDSIVENYKFYLRKYYPWVGKGNFRGNQELVLYAIPNERLAYQRVK